MNLVEHLQTMPILHELVALAHRDAVVRYREAGLGRGTWIPKVLLHGIGSGSTSWVHQLEAAHTSQLGRVLAWDAPGYADSTSLEVSNPSAQHYAQAMWAWLDALGIEKVHLVGHSLGCLMAASAARLQPQRIEALTLLAPAQGYGPAAPEVGSKMVKDRLGMLAELGLDKLARTRGPALLTPNAKPEHIELAVYMMSRLNPAGYAQATQMLAHADIRADLRAFLSASQVVVKVACGELDSITPAAACRALALAVGANYVSLGDVGHLCALQAPTQVDALLGIAGGPA